MKWVLCLGKKLVLTCVLCVSGLGLVMAQHAGKSGTKVINGELFKVHKVEKGQGLYGISRIYNVPVADIIAANPGSDQLLRIDQELYIPTGEKAVLEQAVVKDYFENPQREQEAEEPRGKATFARYHTVGKGETLYAISRMYGTGVDVIRSLNNLSGDELSVGMKLLVPSATDKEQNVDVVPDPVLPSGRGGAVESSPVVPANEQPFNGYETRSERIEEFDVNKFWERGRTEIGYGGKLKEGKTASHHSAELGRTIMVTNPANNEALFVKVVAVHKLDKERANVLILSEEAAEKLGLERGSVVEVSFAR